MFVRKVLTSKSKLLYPMSFSSLLSPALSPMHLKAETDPSYLSCCMILSSKSSRMTLNVKRRIGIAYPLSQLISLPTLN